MVQHLPCFFSLIHAPLVVCVLGTRAARNVHHAWLKAERKGYFKLFIVSQASGA
jgi:hypothetical protein